MRNLCAVLFTAAALLVGATSANAQSEIFFRNPYVGSPQTGWVMGPNGEGKTQTRTGEPSHFKHAGQRWFLVLIPSEYPSVGGWRHTQLHAVREDGASIQLTFVDGTVKVFDARWAKDDSKIALLAHCYAPDGSYVIGRIYLANVNFTDGIPELTTDFESVVASAASARLDSSGFDLSPDSTQIVYSEWQSFGVRNLMIATIGGSSKQIMSGDLNSPRWSHNGQRIVLRSERLGAVGTVRTDGTGWVTLARDGEPLFGPKPHDPHWAPDDSAVTYACRTTKGRDIFRVSASGGKVKNLTSGMNSDLVPVAWRSTINVD